MADLLPLKLNMLGRPSQEDGEQRNPTWSESFISCYGNMGMIIGA